MTMATLTLRCHLVLSLLLLLGTTSRYYLATEAYQISATNHNHHQHLHQPQQQKQSSSSSSGVVSISKIEPWCTATIDYSSANDYILDNYGSKIEHQPYFKEQHQVERIYDARNFGVYDDACSKWTTPTLQTCGFSLHPTNTKVADWRDLDQIRHVYLPELRQLLKTALEQKNAEEGNCVRVKEIHFWHPMLRGESFTRMKRPEDRDRTPSNAVAGVAHVDIDFNGYDSAESIVEMVEKNLIQEESHAHVFDRKRISHLMSQGHRFAVINAWRNIAPQPVTQAPLALLATRYAEGNNNDNNNNNKQKKYTTGFPVNVPNVQTSRWYCFPEMTTNEILLFYQYDRNDKQISDIWHTALPDIRIGILDSDSDSSAVEGEGGSGNGRAGTTPRKSFDLRTLVIFDEKVPTNNDRFGIHRLRSLESI